jgi:hypothetical protein
MKKRVALARAIVTDGTDDQVEQLIMYDEPTAGLDPVASTVVEDLIRGLHVKPEGPGSGAPSGKTLGKTSSSSGYGSPGGGFFDSWSDEDAPSAPVSEGNGGSSPAAAVSVPDAGESSGSGSDSDVPGKHRGISSYVVVTHQHSTIRRSVDRIIFLHAGVVVWEGSVAEFDATEEPIVRQFASGSLNGPIVYL